MNSKTVGDISEAIVIARLLEKGWSVSIPFGDNQRYDLIGDNGSLHRIQVKTGRLADGAITYSTKSSTSAGIKYYRNEVEWFAVYCPETNEVYLIPVATDGPQISKLRVEASRNGQSANINWAKDFVL